MVIASLRKQPTFLHAATCFPMKWSLNNDYKNPILLTFPTQIWRGSECVGLVAVAAHSDIIWRGNQWRRHEMLAVFLKLGRRLHTLGIFEEVVGRTFGADFQDQGSITERERGMHFYGY